MKRNIQQQINSTIWNHLQACLDEIPERTGTIVNASLEDISRDLEAYVKKDPASKGNEEMVLKTYATFMAVTLYRVAHRFQVSGDNQGVITARKISEYAKARSGVEIHPGATIGKAFVVDHGYGTVIGETAIIGDNCYILNNVTLGARGVSNNPNTSRHPIIGNNVEIAASAKVFGNVKIGDNSFIGADVEITEDLPANSRVSCLRIQSHFVENGKSQIREVGPSDRQGEVLISGSNLKADDLECFVQHKDRTETKIEIADHTESELKVRLNKNYLKMKKVLLNFRLKGRTVLKLSMATRFLL